MDDVTLYQLPLTLAAYSPYPTLGEIAERSLVAPQFIFVPKISLNHFLIDPEAATPNFAHATVEQGLMGILGRYKGCPVMTDAFHTSHPTTWIGFNLNTFYVARPDLAAAAGY